MLCEVSTIVIEIDVWPLVKFVDLFFVIVLPCTVAYDNGQSTIFLSLLQEQEFMFPVILLKVRIVLAYLKYQ